MCLFGLFWGGRTIQIMKAKVSDGGKYSCVAMNAAGEAHRHIYLTVFSESMSTLCTQSAWPWGERWIFSCAHCFLVPPSIRDSGGDGPVVVNTLVGKSLTLECETNAVPPPSITWYKNGRVVSGSANLRVLEEGHRLEIRTTGVKIRSCHGADVLCREMSEGLLSLTPDLCFQLGLLGVWYWTICLQSNQHCRTSGQALPFECLW